MDTLPRSTASARRAALATTLERRWFARAALLAAAAASLMACGLDAKPVGNEQRSAFIEYDGVLFDPGIKLKNGLPFLAIEDEEERAAPPPQAPPPRRDPGRDPAEVSPEPSAEPSPAAEPEDEPPSPAPAYLPFLSIDQRLALIRSDLDAFDNAADRARIRYIDLSNLANAGSTDPELEAYRQAISLLVNSLSQGVSVVPPQPIDRGRTLYRLDLRDYAWSANTWEIIVNDYPYAVSYDEDSRVLPQDERTALAIRNDTGTLVPYVQADWLLAHAASAPRYYDILGISSDVLDEARELGVDVLRDVADAQVARAGFNGSEVALNNRVIERHEMPGSSGALWLTYDFVDSIEERNVFAHPTDFAPDQSEGLFSLPNGLHAYFISDGRFRLLNKASTAIVVDPQSRDHAVQAGISCMGGCHLAEGVLSANDEVRAYVVLSAPDGRTIDETLGLYTPRAQMVGLIAADQERYQTAVAATGYEQADPNLLNRMVRTHQDTLDIAGVASVFGIKPGTLARALEASPQVFPPEILPLRDLGARIHRDTLDAVAGAVVDGLGLGVQIRP